jgi:hypothetical protein
VLLLELNLVEYVWAQWKQHEMPNFCPDRFGKLSPGMRNICRSDGCGRPQCDMFLHRGIESLCAVERIVRIA